MNYRALNKNQKDRMNAISNTAYVMEWENPEFMDYLMGELPKIRRYKEDKEAEHEISSLEKVLATYDAFFSEKSAFLEEIAKKISDIQNLKGSWYGLSLYEIETYMSLHSFCLISGEGGIGKSYFIKCFEEQLEQNNIEHLCVYGKFEKNINNINVEEIIKASDEGFVFIFDAINEMSEEGQNNLIDILTEFKEYPRIRIIISYRTNSMDNVILKKYQKISEYEYKFPGVSFESALDEILKLPVPDVYLYEDILYSNNALLLSMLCNVLSSEKIVDETENGVASITYILEHYIKTTINRAFKNNLTCKGVDIWKDTKRVAQWMYRNVEKRIDEKNLLSLIKTGNNFLSSMMQMGFMDGYDYEGVKYYYFAIDSLTDFLIARSLFEDISGKKYQQQVSIIKSKADTLYSLEEALIIAIFDNLTPDYKQIKNLLKDTDLIERLDFRTLVKVHFKSNDINIFKNNFKPLNHSELLMIMGGFTDKPFNCTNYLFDYYCEKRERIIELSNTLAGHHFQNEVKNRLKNILYFTTLNDRVDRRDEEAYYFALLCCAAPNKDVRCLAMKLLYEVVSKNDGYVEKLISKYDTILDLYIQEAIIYVLSQIKKVREKIVYFYNEIIIKQENLTAKSIRRIAQFLGSPYSFIMWNRKDLYKFKHNAEVSDYLNDILFYVDLMNKDFLPFRYWGKDHIDMHTKFLVNDKNEINTINNYLYNKYDCVCGGKCSGWMAFKNRIMLEIEPMAEIKTVDMNSFLESFEKVFRCVFKYYDISADRKPMNIREEDFHHSVYMKGVDIATGLYYGSLMCNYYTNQFATYNNIQNSIGYEVYDPLKYGEDVIITAPIPTYQDFIERLGDYVINSLEMPVQRDVCWVRNIELTRRNVLHLLETVELKKQKWVMLAGRVSLHEEDKYETRWKDTYDLWCCSSENETIYDDGSARYLTIELEEYIGNLNSYPDNESKPWLCKNVKNINNQSEVFEGTSLVLPPSNIIRFFNLKLNISDLSWETQDKEKVIICNNNKNSYYRDPIGGTVFIRKDYFDKFLEENMVKYFAFTERFIPDTGYADETSLHFEIVNGKIEKEIKNNGGYGGWNNGNNPLCSECPHTTLVDDVVDNPSISNIEWLENLLKDY
ncbi:hypothetical protein FUSO7_10900 [Fusobacterium necrophorum BFTR-2]|nr:ATP-binding protein [Fusobacterium necrophorum]KDE70239.1 hypothetical protein FUSO7_10900 [Fusobacterium necrophorum BFTR-2]